MSKFKRILIDDALSVGTNRVQTKLLYADKIDQNQVFVERGSLVCNDPEEELKVVPFEI